MMLAQSTRYRVAGGRVALVVACGVAAGWLGGCGGGSGGSARSGGSLDPAPQAPLVTRGAATTAQPGKTIAVVGDRSISFGELAPLLAEAAGGQVLEEYALGIVLDRECQVKGVRVTEEMVRAERSLLSRQLARAAGVPESEGETLIGEVRRNRGLGEARFRGMLERNAALRALARIDPASAVTVSAEDLETAYQLKYGPRVQARLILTRSRDVATQAMQRLTGGQSFAEVAHDSSIDPSNGRGGLLDAFSLADTNYPVAVRRALQEMQQGQTSDIIALNWGAGNEPGYAIVRLEQTITPAAPAKESVTRELEEEVRLVRERAVMDRLGRDLLNSAGVSVMDRNLGWSWEQWRGVGR